MKTLLGGFLCLCSLSLLAKAPVLPEDDPNFHPPRIIRTCCSFGADLTIAGIPFLKKTDITSPSLLGNHQFLGSETEGNGNIYTQKGGFIDLGHLRDCADWTAYLYTIIKENQKDSTKNMRHLGVEGGNKMLLLNLPPDLDSLEIYQLAGKIAYDLSLWHEIATWFGASYIPLLPERYSSFSPEDLYSNLLGIQIAIKALQSDLPYNEAMTCFIAESLDSLGAVPSYQDTYDAMSKVENIWWTGKKSLPSKNVLLMRYLDSDASLSPWLVPTDTLHTQPHVLTKPKVSQNNLYRLQIKLNYHFPLKALYEKHENRIITQNDFGIFMDYISRELDELTLRNIQKNAKNKK